MTSLYPVLNHFRKSWYPYGHTELIYSPGITVFRHGSDKNFAFRDQTFKTAVITGAAYNLGGSEKDTLPDVVDKDMDIAIRQQLAIAANEGHDSIVLGAFGCGAFKNDPQKMAQRYLDILSEPQHQGLFKTVVFAIPGGDNYDTFWKVFQNKASEVKKPTSSETSNEKREITDKN